MKKIFTLLLILILTGCEIENINYITPVVLSYEPENVLTNSASLGGEVGSEGGKKITEYGIVWSKTEHPTTNDNKIVEGSRIGETFKTYSVFEGNTIYYYRFYAINEIGTGYGKEYSFKTSAEAPCNPITNNKVYLIGNTDPINITYVDISHPSWGFNEGNVEFETSTNKTARIFVQFNEYNERMPLTGIYTVVSGDFGNGLNLSTGKAKLFIQDYGLYGYGGADAEPGTKFYVKNENNVVTIIFCDTPVGKKYVLNGKFSFMTSNKF
ncbi:hypothetical protein [Flavobacterium flavigenum]|uniref:hypothetical protein n=1 Tax=Flavobacterium flavigenum TaxID=3003258 RepID=UPI0022ABED74|nr:hypothetical protein [Flavobacterium flavigenum]